MKKANNRPIHIKPTGADPDPMRGRREPVVMLIRINKHTYAEHLKIMLSLILCLSRVFLGSDAKKYAVSI